MSLKYNFVTLYRTKDYGRKERSFFFLNELSVFEIEHKMREPKKNVTRFVASLFFFFMTGVIHPRFVMGLSPCSINLISISSVWQQHRTFALKR